MSDITVRVGGQKYLVSGEGRGATVRVIIPRSVVNVDGFRTLKHGSVLWKAAVKQAAYERARPEAK
ncbi:hypothetical protein [Ancylobacter defluvii]|uniref:Uncharacterized protein n=1 Tax=Ancylobacter defluvii TaxID=1282440 RepID=A0A9W6JXK3_9HYPH|nr:hypothetical protein [Ancylobacter defluvii]MBS7586444.1 hypothetical protein [Ancylobacter defluvii]GLK85725.1 hypothetical protein GCM10017653_37950 [Ancylobacter defluvii]